MSDDELRTWAEAHSDGPMRSPVAVAVLRLLGRIDDRAAMARRCHDLTDKLNELTTRQSNSVLSL